MNHFKNNNLITWQEGPRVTFGPLTACTFFAAQQFLASPCVALTGLVLQPYLWLPPSTPFHPLLVSVWRFISKRFLSSFPVIIHKALVVLNFLFHPFLFVIPLAFGDRYAQFHSLNLCYVRNSNCLLPFPVSSTVHLSPEAEGRRQAAAKLALDMTAINSTQKLLDMTCNNAFWVHICHFNCSEKKA